MKLYIVSSWNDSFQGSNTQVENWVGTEHHEAYAKIYEIVGDNGGSEEDVDRMMEKVPIGAKSGKRANWTDGDGGHVQLQAFDIQHKP